LGFDQRWLLLVRAGAQNSSGCWVQIPGNMFDRLWVQVPDKTFVFYMAENGANFKGSLHKSYLDAVHFAATGKSQLK
jgi:hypothetical protein